ncbi:hypothetical protein [Nocardia otitidiscaviarum]|uniref:hypothetical protein n=1 Tax=Nocardia otitidiscaviarum TaxID=1823 RepID=UPI0004A6ED1D|nr:hypothetical protein [Nocardia otitidiscaviarum]
MTETVTRHRGGGLDSDGNPMAWVDTPLTVRAVAPGATVEYVDRGRDGDRVDFTIYHVPELDITNRDEVTVRGRRCRVQVEQWISPHTSRTGTVVLCSSGEG